MSYTRAVYKANHSALRAMTRYEKDRSGKLHQLLMDRLYWRGDAYSKPSEPGAVAALDTLFLRWKPNDTMHTSTLILAWNNPQVNPKWTPEFGRDNLRTCCELRRLSNNCIIRKLP